MDSRGELWGRGKEQRYLLKWKKTQNTDSGIADILVTFGASVAFHKTYEQVAQFTTA